ncbi:segregation/condensation protein A [Roseomonas hellenica]|uniref:Segregation and condensation protein A n=1 Tax=Plastoroseomonas hellenica TaxID=2687306 RepID=A0ABS5EVP8_9PROT|nr:ScpA family protein [Plastoroseomonas hellenica]MBR0664363.1 segregation/condensation protein A [Plastoroseomonas hellenica]
MPDVPASAAAADAADWDDGGGEGRALRAGGAPRLSLDGFEGPLDFLLEMVRQQKVDLGRLSVASLCDQFVAALDADAGRVPLERRADWVVMASTLVALKAQLLAPATPEAAAAAEADAERHLRRWDELLVMRAAAHWLSARLQLGVDVFGRGGRSRTVRPQAELQVAFLEATLAMLEGSGAQRDQEMAATYRPIPPDVWSLPEALAQLVRRLQAHPAGAELRELAPRRAGASPLRARSAIASTFLAGLELARQDQVGMRQACAFGPIVLSPAAASTRT